jgi:pilus assembly protein CpaF
MTGTDDKQGLIGLLSSRGGGRRLGVRADTSSEVKGLLEEHSSREGDPTVRGSASGTGTAGDGSKRLSQSESEIRGGGLSRTDMSELASNVLREARRELGGASSLRRAEEQGRSLDETIAEAVDRVLSRRGEKLDDVERVNVILALRLDLTGWGVLQPLIDNREVTDIHVYDYKTIVLQRGKVSEMTGLSWPNHQAYISFLDRLLLRLGKSLSTQQHTVDAALPNGIRLCAVHESVCGQRGPLLCVRVPRLSEVHLENLITYQVAPPLIVHYLAALVRSGLVTMMISGETGTGKTTLMKCLGTQFGESESIVAVEDTPEVNFQHPYFRSLVSRPPNAEGQGEVTLQQHIITTLRMTPTRVILGEMRSPFAAEAFLESAQTGHVGMATVHARNARETLTRLESLLGRAQKSVALEIIRQQIALAIDMVIWLFRDKETGRPRVGEIVEVGHYVEGMIQVRPMFKILKTGQNPVWKLESWSSSFDEQLSEAGIHLGSCQQEFGFSGTGGLAAPRGR